MASKPRFFNGVEFKIHFLKQAVDISVHKAKKKYFLHRYHRVFFTKADRSMSFQEINTFYNENNAIYE